MILNVTPHLIMVNHQHKSLIALARLCVLSVDDKLETAQNSYAVCA